MDIMTKFPILQEANTYHNAGIICHCLVQRDQSRDGVAPAFMIRAFRLQPPFSQSKPLPGRRPMGAPLGSGTWVPSPICTG